MKGISIAGFIIAVLVFIGAAYLQFVVSPSVDALEKSINYNDESNFSSILWANAHSAKTSFGIVMLFGSLVPFLLCLIPAIKVKNKLAWVGVILSLFGIIIGLLQGTHMFS